MFDRAFGAFAGQRADARAYREINGALPQGRQNLAATQRVVQ